MFFEISLHKFAQYQITNVAFACELNVPSAQREILLSFLILRITVTGGWVKDMQWVAIFHITIIISLRIKKESRGLRRKWPLCEANRLLGSWTYQNQKKCDIRLSLNCWQFSNNSSGVANATIFRDERGKQWNLFVNSRICSLKYCSRSDKNFLMFHTTW